MSATVGLTRTRTGTGTGTGADEGGTRTGMVEVVDVSVVVEDASIAAIAMRSVGMKAG
jgi:hypothetical protein